MTTRVPGRDGLIYIVADRMGNFKVGFTNCQGMADRLSDLQIGNPFQLSVVYSRIIPLDITIHIEQMAHQLLAAHHIRGEWFRGKSDMIIKAVNDCVERALGMDDAIEDLIAIAEQQKQVSRLSQPEQTDLQEVMFADIRRSPKLGSTIRSTHGRLRAPLCSQQRRKK